MTRKLYYEDQYLRKFTAVVEDVCESGGKTAVVLDQTAFFPEGGGQSSDRGRIGDAHVVDVQIKDGVIYHFISGKTALRQGDKAECEIDWKKRFSDMQQHSAEHIFSGIIHNLYGLENVGFHLGDTVVTLDFNAVLSEEQLERVEFLVNGTIWENRKITAFFPTEDELKGLAFRSKKEIDEELRLVEIEGIDLCACCAPHVSQTGEIGLAKIVGTEKIRGGTRISILCGDRGFSDIKEKLDQNKQISVLLSEKEKSSFSAVEKLKKEKEKLDYEVFALKTELMKQKAASKEQRNIIIDFCNFSGDDLRRYTDMLAEKASEFAMALSGSDDDFRFVMISKTGSDIDHFVSELKDSIPVKGGGRNGIIQGTISASRAEIERLIYSFFL